MDRLWVILVSKRNKGGTAVGSEHPVGHSTYGGPETFEVGVAETANAAIDAKRPKDCVFPNLAQWTDIRMFDREDVEGSLGGYVENQRLSVQRRSATGTRQALCHPAVAYLHHGGCLLGFPIHLHGCNHAIANPCRLLLAADQ